MVKIKKNGFTLIELLAVIIILGILMIIAIPSVTTYINNSRKSAYVNTAREIISGARNFVNEGKISMYDPNATYYIKSSCINTENGQKTPYGEFVDNETYVVVTFDGKGYDYYWVSRDTSGTGVPVVTALKDLNEEKIESNIELGTIVPAKISDEKPNVLIINDNCNGFEESSGGSESNVVVYPEGKTKSTVAVGDLVKIGDEEFYVISNDGSDLVLLSHYNLNVGSNKKAGATEGIQDSEVKGYVTSGTKYGNIAFSSTNYWNGKVGEGLDYPGSNCSSNTYTSGTNCTYVYDANSNLKTYVDSYKTYLEGKGATIKSARLLRVEEAFELGCGQGQWSCSTSPANAPSWVYETSYWLGSARNTSVVWGVYSYGDFYGCTYDYGGDFGVRPVIII